MLAMQNIKKPKWLKKSKSKYDPVEDTNFKFNDFEDDDSVYHEINERDYSSVCVPQHKDPVGTTTAFDNQCYENFLPITRKRSLSDCAVVRHVGAAIDNKSKLPRDNGRRFQYRNSNKEMFSPLLNNQAFSAKSDSPSNSSNASPFRYLNLPNNNLSSARSLNDLTAIGSPHQTKNNLPLLPRKQKDKNLESSEENCQVDNMIYSSYDKDSADDGSVECSNILYHSVAASPSRDKKLPHPKMSHKSPIKAERYNILYNCTDEAIPPQPLPMPTSPRSPQRFAPEITKEHRKPPTDLPNVSTKPNSQKLWFSYTNSSACNNTKPQYTAKKNKVLPLLPDVNKQEEPIFGTFEDFRSGTNDSD